MCHSWCFLDKNSKYEPYLCNGCHDLMQKAMNFNDVAIFMLKETVTEYTFGIWAKVKQLV